MKRCVVDMRRMLYEGLNKITKSQMFHFPPLFAPLSFNLLFKLGPGRVWRKLYIKAFKMGALQKGGRQGGDKGKDARGCERV